MDRIDLVKIAVWSRPSQPLQQFTSGVRVTSNNERPFVSEKCEASAWQLKSRKVSQAAAHRRDLAAAVHMGFAAEDSPHVLHLCEVVDCLAQLESAHAIHLRAHLRQISLRWLAMCCKAPYPCSVQYVTGKGSSEFPLLRVTLVPHCCAEFRSCIVVCAR